MSVIRCLLLTALLAPVSLIAAQLSFEGLPTGEAFLKQAPGGHLFAAVAGENGVVRHLRDGRWEIWTEGEIEGFEIRADGKPERTFASRLGEVWSSKAGFIQRRSGKRILTGSKSTAESWLEPMCDDSFGNIWAARVDAQGRSVGLAVLAFEDSGGWQSVKLPQELTGKWSGFFADDVGFVWLATRTEAVQINPRAANGGIRRITSPAGARITSIARVANRQIVAGFSDGSIRELTTYPKKEPVWRLLEAMPGGAVRAMLHAMDGSLWAVVGTKIYKSNALRETWHEHWKEQPRMPAGNHDNIFARIGNKLYTAGGKTYFGWPATEWVNLDHVWTYNISDGTWAVEPPMLEPGKAYPGIATMNEELWIIGGLFRAERGTKATATVEIYDPRTRRYRFGPKYPAARGQIVALTVGGRLYAVGGENLPVSGASAEMFSIGPGETEWRPAPPAPGPLMQAAGCVVNGKMYISSGPVSECPGFFVYDPAERKWSSVSHPAEPAPRASLVAAMGDEIWVMGGRGKTAGVKATYAYSTTTGEWTKGPDLPLPVSWGAAAQVNGKILIAGGAYREASAGGIFNSDRVFFLDR